MNKSEKKYYENDPYPPSLFKTPALILIFLVLPFIAIADTPLHSEKSYVDHYCAENEYRTAEYRLKDGARIDCLIYSEFDIYTVEFDFSGKWAEAIGQALYYSTQIPKSTPAIVLIDKRGTPAKTIKTHHTRLRNAIAKLRIKIRVACLNSDGERYYCNI